MLKDVKSLVERCIAVDEPIEYNGIFIHPVTVKQYYDFKVSYDILCIEKNKIPDVKIIQMNYLDFLCETLFLDNTPLTENQTVGEFYQSKLWRILCLALKISPTDINFVRDTKHWKLIISGNIFNSNEFDEIRRIILYQNIYDYNEEYISPDAQRVINDYYEIKNKDIVNPSLNKKIIAVMTCTGMSKKDILEMNCLDFENLFRTSLDEVDYMIQKTAEMSGEVKFSKPVEHWVWKRKKNRFEDVFMSEDNVTNKLKI